MIILLFLLICSRISRMTFFLDGGTTCLGTLTSSLVARPTEYHNNILIIRKIRIFAYDLTGLALLDYT